MKVRMPLDTTESVSQRVTTLATRPNTSMVTSHECEFRKGYSFSEETSESFMENGKKLSPNGHCSLQSNVAVLELSSGTGADLPKTQMSLTA